MEVLFLRIYRSMCDCFAEHYDLDRFEMPLRTCADYDKKLRNYEKTIYDPV